jgi:hypothetical protein
MRGKKLGDPGDYCIMVSSVTYVPYKYLQGNKIEETVMCETWNK